MKPNEQPPLIEQLKTLSQQSLIKVQYSCGGNSTGIDETDDYIPIVPDEVRISFRTTIRRAEPYDTEQIVALLKKQQVEIPLSNECKRLFLVAEHENKIAGCAIVDLQDAVCNISAITVADNLQRQGIGAKLLHAACLEAKTSGATEIRSITNRGMQRFFEKAGWTTNTIDQADTIAESAVRMTLRIS